MAFQDIVNYGKKFLRFLLLLLGLYTLGTGPVSSKPAPAKSKTSTTCSSDLNGKFVSYIDALFFVEKCTLRPLDSAFVMADFAQSWDVIEISADVYRSLPMGRPLEPDEEEESLNHDRVLTLCALAGTEGRVVSTNNQKFYFIQLCQKKLIPDFTSASELPNGDVAPVLSIAPEVLDLIPTGRPLPTAPYAKLFPEKDELEVAATLSPQKLCRGLKEGQLFSFHEAYYCLRSCQLQPVPAPSLEEQQLWDTRGGIVELTAEQRLGLMAPPSRKVQTCPAS